MGRALLNVAASVILCVAAVSLGHIAAAQLNDHAKEIAQIEIEEDA
jgi:CrcB protein